MFDHMPLISVAMPVFNAGKYLRAAVTSILNQTESNWELLLIDDGSTDNAVAELVDIKDVRIRLIQDGINLGLAARLNQAIDLARGRYFARMDQDDISHPERFARQLALLQSKPEVDLVGTRCLTISEDGVITGVLPGPETHEQICRRPWLGFYLPHPTWMGRLEWFRRYRYACPGPYFCEDQEFLLRVHEASRFYVLADYLLAYRLRDAVRWRKVWKTRLTLHGIQRHYFLQQKNYLYAFLSAMSFLGRLLFDISFGFIFILQRLLFASPLARLPLSENELTIWRKVILPKVNRVHG